MKALDDLINGNLKDAKAAAKRVQAWKIAATAREEYGHTPVQAIAAVDYLKGYGSFQAYCDAMNPFASKGQP